MKTKLVNVLVIIVPILLVIGLVYYQISKKENESSQPNSVLSINTNEVKLLENQIDSLKMELEMQSTGFDSKEKRYEEIIFEYRWGIDYLRDYHPEAYRDFHRLLAHKENFNRKDEEENIKRLNSYNE
jgi:uncharacterized protein YxeA